MEPIEINAGDWYLRAPRADDRVDDRPALADLGETDPEYVARSAAGWAADTGYTWAVCEPVSGELLAEVTLNPVSGELASRTRRGHPAAAVAAGAAVQTVGRFAAGALGLTVRGAEVVGVVATEEDPAHPGGGGH